MFAEPSEPLFATLPRPRVTLHFAQSLDGRIATRSRSGCWLSGPLATRFAHELRAASNAIIVGSGTALADDPLLTVRHVDGPHPIRVLLDARARVPARARLFTDRTSPTIHATCTPDRATRGGPPHVERWILPRSITGEGVDLSALLARLSQQGIRTILVEGGGRVLTSFLHARLVDRLIITIAPVVLGTGVDAIGDLAVEQMEQALRFTTQRVFQLGEDVLLDVTPRLDEAPAASAKENAAYPLCPDDHGPDDLV
jgi:riboflavin-specific deaminase-like protein